MLKTGLAIVGASAAGLAAALAAARAGADVTLLEAKREIGVPASPAIVGMDWLWPEQVARPAHTTYRRLAGTKVRASDGRGVYVDAPLTLFRRDRFDAWLADEARKAGVRVVTGVKGLDARPDLRLVAEGLEVQPEILLFADGARTQAARFMRSTRDPGAVQQGAVLEFTAPEPAGDGRLYQTVGPHAPGGRSQLTPLGEDRWTHWTFFHGDPARAEAMARKALELDARLMGWEDVDARFVGHGPDPLFTLPGQLVAGRVMATGGAAGQGGFETGLSSGWIAGDVAARALQGKASLDEYPRAWRRKFRHFYDGLRRTSEMFARLTDAEVRDYFAAWDGRHIPARSTLGTVLRNPRGIRAHIRAARIARTRDPPPGFAPLRDDEAPPQRA
jgi:flavin-dependent dehydrogenase